MLSKENENIAALSDEAPSGAGECIPAEFLAPAYWQVEHPVPSSWSEHLPFMFCLISHLRPRRYVELGTHFGASFYAACQAVKRNALGSECIAIDLWQGDVHAGNYSEDVFERFVSVLESSYKDIGRYIRRDFDSASTQFAEGSIDLLHIDGLHTYEAVKNDFQTWLPKVSDCGVIIFHDTAVRERGFGVHRLWDEISGDYPSFNFTHGYGLGVIYAGSRPDTPGAMLLDMLRSQDMGPLMRLVLSSHSRARIEIEDCKRQLADIHDSTGFKALLKLYRLRDMLRPGGQNKL